mmetsp:Transcript_14687/g.21721  ORF Transcript_14687/g.21721 Transcript_14687/m.21721 type:complete len:346 (-) Transcript_14687:446-1483(-)
MPAHLIHICNRAIAALLPTLTSSFSPIPGYNSLRHVNQFTSIHSHNKKKKITTTEEDYARIFGNINDDKSTITSPTITSSLLLEQDPWQEELILRKNSPYNEMCMWYLQCMRESNVHEDIAHWGIPYRTYVDEYVKEFAELIPIRPGDRVFDSAVGSGWLIRGLVELNEQQQQDDDGIDENEDWDNSVEWFGNDILPDALNLARRDISNGQFVLADSANLTWAPANTFDSAICGYIEPSPDALVAAGYEPTAVQEWFGNWVAQMARLVRPGGHVCIGAVQTPLALGPTHREQLRKEWWKKAARGDVYGWDVNPESVVIRPLTSKLLKKEWDQRYCVRMTKKQEKL